MKIARCGLLLLLCATAILWAGSRAVGQKSAFTLSQVLSAPFPSDLVAARTKNRFAWVFNREGKRNIWIAEPAANGSRYTARQITKYSEDDGQDVGELVFTPDAESIVYTRGGDLEFSEKPYPNPAKIVEGAEQDVWVSSLEGEPRKIGEGHSPAVSPKGELVAYRLKGQIWLAKLDGSEKPQQLMHTRGEASALHWSPDGNFLAFVSGRQDHAFIGIYSFASKTISYPDTSTDKDSEPVWSPDSRKVAFRRIPSSIDDLLFKPRRTGMPWSIRVIDVGTGMGHEVWRASQGRGSVFREVTAENQLLWAAENKIVFPWEGDGWTHLYAVPADGGTPILLTPGPFEVESVSLSPDLEFVVYSSNQDDVDRRHIWRVGLGGSSPTQMTKGTGIEIQAITSSDGKAVAMLRSDARLPLHMAVLSGTNDIHDLAGDALPSDFPKAQMVAPQPVIFPAADGMAIHGQLFLPAGGGGPTRYPAVIFFHGGSRRQMLLGWHYMAYYSNAYAMNQYLASRGYVVLSVNYRSGIGYGLDFREALNYGAAGASEFNDVQGAGLYLRTRNDVAGGRIGLWGGSYGGYLTALGLARSSDLFRAGVDMHGVHDWSEELKNWSPSYDPSLSREIARLAWESSPMASVQNWRSPVLLVHGDDDRNVPFSQTVILAEALRKQGVPFEELIFPDEIHDFLLYRSWLRAYQATAEFFDQNLKAGPSADR